MNPGDGCPTTGPLGAVQEDAEGMQMGDATFRSPEFLGGRSHTPTLRVRCPIHGFIRFSPAERSIIDHPLFRRLRWIRQLALTEYVYPGATHSRFEHSLGVMEVATRMFDTLARNHGGVMEKTFSSVEALRDSPMAKSRQLVRLAALLHDVGHCAFSHAAEEVLHKDRGHEALSVRVIAERDFLGPLLDRTFFPDAARLTAALVGKGFPPQMQVLRDIVSGQVDADRTDYLLRDSHHCGVEYGRFDYRRLIECLEVAVDADSGGLEVAISRDGLHPFEALILARYQMNTQVYHHRLRRIYDHYLKQYFEKRGPEGLESEADILRYVDYDAMSDIRRDADGSGPAAGFAKRIVERRHHRKAFESEELEGEEVQKRLLRRFGRVESELSANHPILDVAKIGMHKLKLREDKEGSGFVRVRLLDRGVPDAEERLVTEESRVLARIPRDFFVLRVFLDVGESERDMAVSRCRAIMEGRT